MSNQEIADRAVKDALLIEVDGELQDTLFACVDRKISTKVFIDKLNEEFIKALDAKDSQAQAKIAELRGIIKVKDLALKNIGEMFDGEADIDNNGGPNRAMAIDSIVETSLNHHEASEGGK